MTRKASSILKTAALMLFTIAAFVGGLLYYSDVWFSAHHVTAINPVVSKRFEPGDKTVSIPLGNSATEKAVADAIDQHTAYATELSKAGEAAQKELEGKLKPVQDEILKKTPKEQAQIQQIYKDAQQQFAAKNGDIQNKVYNAEQTIRVLGPVALKERGLPENSTLDFKTRQWVVPVPEKKK